MASCGDLLNKHELIKQQERAWLLESLIWHWASAVQHLCTSASFEDEPAVDAHLQAVGACLGLAGAHAEVHEVMANMAPEVFKGLPLFAQ